MKKIFILIVIALSIATVLFAQKTPFEKFDSSRIDVGTMYVYEYSENKEDFEPSSKEYLYIKTLNDIETMWEDINDTLALPDIFNYTLNWDYMMLEKMYYKSLVNKKDIENHYSYTQNYSVDFAKKTFKTNTYGKEDNRLQHFNNKWKFEKIPTYFYGYTDLMPLWFALRFYPLEKEKITVNSLTGSYNVNFDIQYDGKENVNVPFGKVLCYKFELSPQLSFFAKLFHSPKKVFIWLTSEDSSRYMVKYKNNNARDSETPLIEYRLAERKKMTPEEWEKFKKNHGALRVSP